MASQAGKLAPLFLTLAGAGYCVWPYVQTQTPPAEPKTDMPKIEAHWLDPKFPPASPRNLFQPVLPESVAAAAKIAEQAKLEQARKAELDAKKQQEHSSLLDGWSLGATLMHGGRRGAVINGKDYLEGDTIPAPRPEGESLTLFRVERDRVILLRSKRTQEVILVYSPTKKTKAPETALGSRKPGAATSVSLLGRLVAAIDGEKPATPPAPAIPDDGSTPKEDPASGDVPKPGDPVTPNPGEAQTP